MPPSTHVCWNQPDPPEKVNYEVRTPGVQHPSRRFRFRVEPHVNHFHHRRPGENASTSLPHQLELSMALNSSRSAWSLPRKSLRPLRASTSTIITARPPCRASHGLARHPTALRERDDPLNEPVSERDLETARPRWSYTPPAMMRRHDFSLNPIKDPRRAIWHVNEDPAKLEDFYERFLGRHGSRMLPEELRWLAVTHKSFDYGRRGFNTKLAYFGRPVPRGARLRIRGRKKLPSTEAPMADQGMNASQAGKYWSLKP